MLLCEYSKGEGLRRVANGAGLALNFWRRFLSPFALLVTPWSMYYHVRDVSSSYGTRYEEYGAKGYNGFALYT